MDNENQSSTQDGNGGGSKKWLWIAVVAAIVILALAAGGYLLTKNQSKSAENNTPSVNGNEDTAQPTIEPTAVPSKSTYKDGTYSATGSYITPGGTEQIGVKLTIADGKITDATVVQLAKSPTAKLKQADFAQNFRQQVVGQDIESLKLVKVSGSSLSPKGFNAAVDDIKTQAQS